MTPLYWFAALAGITAGLRLARAVRRYLGPIQLEAPSPYGSVSPERAELMRKYGR